MFFQLLFIKFALAPTDLIVGFGDSYIEYATLAAARPDQYCAGKAFIDRGISGSTAGEWAARSCPSRNKNGKTCDVISYLNSINPAVYTLTDVWLAIGGNDFLQSPAILFTRNIYRYVSDVMEQIRSVYPNVNILHIGYAMTVGVGSLPSAGAAWNQLIEMEVQIREAVQENDGTFISIIEVVGMSQNSWGNSIYFVDTIHLNNAGYCNIWRQEVFQDYWDCGRRSYTCLFPMPEDTIACGCYEGNNCPGPDDCAGNSTCQYQGDDLQTTLCISADAPDTTSTSIPSISPILSTVPELPSYTPTISLNVPTTLPTTNPTITITTNIPSSIPVHSPSLSPEFSPSKTPQNTPSRVPTISPVFSDSTSTTTVETTLLTSTSAMPSVMSTLSPTVETTSIETTQSTTTSTSAPATPSVTPTLSPTAGTTVIDTTQSTGTATTTRPDTTQTTSTTPVTTNIDTTTSMTTSMEPITPESTKLGTTKPSAKPSSSPDTKTPLSPDNAGISDGGSSSDSKKLFDMNVVFLIAAIIQLIVVLLVIFLCYNGCKPLSGSLISTKTKKWTIAGNHDFEAKSYPHIHIMDANENSITADVELQKKKSTDAGMAKAISGGSEGGEMLQKPSASHAETDSEVLWKFHSKSK